MTWMWPRCDLDVTWMWPRCAFDISTRLEGQCMSKLTLNTNLPQQTSDGRVRPLSKLSFLMHPQMALCVPSRNFISDFDQYLTSDGSVGPLSKLSFLCYPHRVFLYNISNISYATPGCFFQQHKKLVRCTLLPNARFARRTPREFQLLLRISRGLTMQRYPWPSQHLGEL